MKLTTISNIPASILGLAGNKSIDARCLERAFSAGVNYFFFYELSAIENLVDAFKGLLADTRQDIIIATGSESRDLRQLKQYLDSVRNYLGTDVIDVFFLEYVSPADDLTQVQTLLQELETWKKRGSIRYLGISTHNRAIALDLIDRGQIDVLMHRYNMAHRKAERDVFPAVIEAKIPAIAFTCTRWGALLKGHPNWQDRLPTAADCYRYALSNKAISLALTSPQTLAELEENLSVLNHFQLTEAELVLWRSYGDLIYGKGQDSFETQWL